MTIYTHIKEKEKNKQINNTKINSLNANDLKMFDGENDYDIVNDDRIMNKMIELM